MPHDANKRFDLVGTVLFSSAASSAGAMPLESLLAAIGNPMGTSNVTSNDTTWKEIAKGYDEIADQIWETPSLYKDALRLAPDAHGHVLDVGCGQGLFLELVSKSCPKINTLSGCDISPRLIEMSKARLPRADFQVANAHTLEQYPDAKFDYLFMIGSLEHMIEHEKVLRSAYRVLKRGGVICVAVPNAAWVNYHKWLKNRTQFQPVDDYWFHPDELTGLMEKVGFRVQKVRGLWALLRGNWIHHLENLAAFFIPVLHKRMKLIGVRAVK